MARILVFAVLCLLAACGQRARLSYVPERSTYPVPGTSDDPWGPFIDEASNRFNVPAPWIRAVMHQESGGNEYLDGQPITSSAGAIGLMQLMPATYADLQSQNNLGGDPYDPHDNIMAGTAYIRQMYDKYGSPGFLAAYNAGPARVDDYLAGQGGLPAETENYVASIAPHLADAAPVPVAVAQAGPAPDQVVVDDSRCWHDPNVAYDPRAPCQSPPVVEALAAEPATEPAPYTQAESAIGHYEAIPLPSGMTSHSPPPVQRISYAPPRPVRTKGSLWSVQVGAFGRADEAQLAAVLAQRAAPALAASRPLVTTTGGLGGHVLYRARLADLDRIAASSACTMLRQQSLACILVPPGG